MNKRSWSWSAVTHGQPICWFFFFWIVLIQVAFWGVSGSSHLPLKPQTAIDTKRKKTDPKGPPCIFLFRHLTGSRESHADILQISQTHHHSIYKAPHTLLVLSWGVINLPLCQCGAPLKVHQNTRAAAYLAVATFAGAEIAALWIVLCQKSLNDSVVAQDH